MEGALGLVEFPPCPDPLRGYDWELRGYRRLPHVELLAVASVLRDRAVPSARIGLSTYRLVSQNGASWPTSRLRPQEAASRKRFVTGRGPQCFTEAAVRRMMFSWSTGLDKTNKLISIRKRSTRTRTSEYPSPWTSTLNLATNLIFFSERILDSVRTLQQVAVDLELSLGPGVAEAVDLYEVARIDAVLARLLRVAPDGPRTSPELSSNPRPVRAEPGPPTQAASLRGGTTRRCSRSARESARWRA